MSDEVRQVKQTAFLAALSKSGITRIAAEAAGIHRSTHQYWLENDADYATLAQVALEDAADVVEAELLRRGTVGMRQYKFHEGQITKWKGPDDDWPQAVPYYEDKRSDACLIVTAKARRPEKFRERHEVTGASGGPLAVVHANIGLARMIHKRPELAEQLRQLADAADEHGNPADGPDNGHVPAR